MQSYCKAALTGLILLTEYAPAPAQGVHHIYFNFPPRLTAILIEPKIAGQRDERGIREIVKNAN